MNRKRKSGLQQGLSEIIAKQTAPVERKQTTSASLLEKFRESPEASPLPTIPQRTIPQYGIATDASAPARSQKYINRREIDRNIETIPQPAIPHYGIPQTDTPADSLIDPANGYYPTFNDVSDRLIPTLKLDVYEQSILWRLYRLSRGWRQMTSEVGYGKLASDCNISRSKAQEIIKKLCSRGLLERLASENNTDTAQYVVLPNIPAIPPRGIPQEGIPPYGEAMPQRGIESQYGIPQHGTNKNNKDTNTNTHTNAGVGSKFSLEECKRYADNLHKTGQGITNPGGYATKINRSGEADALIEKFLSPSPVLDISKCPDCEGKGYYFPDPSKPETRRCTHERLQT